MIAALLLMIGTTSAPVVPLPVNATAQSSGHCLVTRSMLTGVWVQRSPPDEMFPQGDSREFVFVVKDGRQQFREYLHHRPGSDGSWRLVGCRLSLIRRGWHEEYDVIRLSRSSLRLRHVGQTDIERFERVEP